MKYRKWSLYSKILLGYILIVACLGLLLVSVSSRLSSLQKETDYISSHDLEVHNQTNMIEKLMLDMETAQRGFIITGDEAYLEPYNEAVRSWKNEAATLEGLISDNPDQQAKLNDIEQQISEWISSAGDVSIEDKRNGNTQAVNAFFANDPGKPIIDHVRTEFENFRSAEKTATATRVANLADGNQKLVQFILILWLAVAALSLASGIIVARNILSNLRQVTNAIRDIRAGGNLTQRVTVKTRDEFLALGDETNLLLERVDKENRQKEDINELIISLQNMSSAAELSHTLLTRLATIFKWPVGAIYMSNGEHKLIMTASHNLDKNKVEQTVEIGSGIVGQCAANKTRITVHPVPANAIRTKTGLAGEILPVYLSACPLFFENELIAVLEYGTFEDMQEEDVIYLDELLSSSATTIHSLSTRMELDKLYRESQAINEEMQVQTEEMQAQAEEMQAQTEELTMQAEELQNLNDRLELQKTIAENSAIELEKFSKELEISSNYKSEFLTNMSHELRTPLNSMLILSQILAENQNGTLSSEEVNYASVIHNSGKDLLYLINDILDLSKVEAGQMEIEEMEVSVDDLLNGLRMMFEVQADQKSLEFIIQCELDVPKLFTTDSQRVQQILKNLLSNAFKFTDQGHVSLLVSKTSKIMPDQAMKEYIAFTVEDSGIGIPADKQDVIFEAFRQAEGSTSRRYGGTGLGLSISLQLARLLGGDVTVESAPGKGSRFTLYLPIGAYERLYDGEPDYRLLLPETAAAKEAEVIETDHLAAQGAGEDMEVFSDNLFRNKTVLIVDDDIRNVYALTSFLEKYNMKVLIAQNGYESLDVVSQEPVDLVLMDIMMPEMDGYQAIKEIRTTLGFTDLPIIALTAKAMKEDRDKCLAAGASDYVSKPLNVSHVLRIMRYWLEKNTEDQHWKIKG